MEVHVLLSLEERFMDAWELGYETRTLHQKFGGFLAAIFVFAELKLSFIEEWCHIRSFWAFVVVGVVSTIALYITVGKVISNAGGDKWRANQIKKLVDRIKKANFNPNKPNEMKKKEIIEVQIERVKTKKPGTLVYYFHGFFKITWLWSAYMIVTVLFL